MWKLTEPGVCGSVPIQSKKALSPSRQIVSCSFSGAEPRPSSSTQSQNVTFSSGMYRRASLIMPCFVRSSRASQAAI